MYQYINDQLRPKSVQLVAVSKTKPNEAIAAMYALGQRVFGENNALELKEKHATLPKDIQWHFIGHLQTNKVKYIAPFVQLIHAVDSLRLLEEIDKQAKKNHRIINCLLQFKIAKEATKQGGSLEDGEAILQAADYQSFKNIKIIGVMGMATFTDNAEQVRSEFRALHDIFRHLQTKYFITQPDFREISMGMSDDFHIAIEEGSTMVRIGSLLFKNDEIRNTKYE
jgi:PLP dependent protein